ncbi:hypothetical protein ABIB38_004639 [Massilia sp. UYP11]|uniref:hypothetical protein n=1 Tax=Massilia sp. UYP11 TaxID=1756385 RepID=UPI003D1CC273
MIKKCLAFAVTLLTSLNASASYTKYEFTGGLLDGYFVQRDDNQAIAHFSFNMTTLMTAYLDPNYDSGPPMTLLSRHQFYPFFNDGAKLLTAASTYFGPGGPTNFTIHDDFGGDQVTDFSIRFTQASEGTFIYTFDYSRWMYLTAGYAVGSGSYSGAVMEVPMPEYMSNELDNDGGYYPGVPIIVPELIGSPVEVAEPASVALISMGALCVAGLARRRRSLLSQ